MELERTETGRVRADAWRVNYARERFWAARAAIVRGRTLRAGGDVAGADDARDRARCELHTALAESGVLRKWLAPALDLHAPIIRGHRMIAWSDSTRAYYRLQWRDWFAGGVAIERRLPEPGASWSDVRGSACEWAGSSCMRIDGADAQARARADQRAIDLYFARWSRADLAAWLEVRGAWIRRGKGGALVSDHTRRSLALHAAHVQFTRWWPWLCER